MTSRGLRQQAVPLVIVVVLVTVAGISAGVNRRVSRMKRGFSVEHYERLMHRIDAAIDSIADTMISEGMAIDFEEMRRHAGTDLEESSADPDVAARGALTLTGIIWHELDPLAVINGKLVGKGERISGAQVVGVKPSQVVVRYEDGTERTLALEEQDE